MQLASKYSFIKTVSIGKSFEGREMRVIEIRKAGPGKPIVWIEAGKNLTILKSSIINYPFYVGLCKYT